MALKRFPWLPKVVRQPFEGINGDHIEYLSGQYDPFEFEEFLLDRKAAAETGQGMVFTNDTVAGDNYRDGVFAVGKADRPAGFGVAQQLSDF